MLQKRVFWGGSQLSDATPTLDVPTFEQTLDLLSAANVDGENLSLMTTEWEGVKKYRNYLNVIYGSPLVEGMAMKGCFLLGALGHGLAGRESCSHFMSDTKESIIKSRRCSLSAMHVLYV